MLRDLMAITSSNDLCANPNASYLRNETLLSRLIGARNTWESRKVITHRRISDGESVSLLTE